MNRHTTGTPPVSQDSSRRQQPLELASSSVNNNSDGESAGMNSHIKGPMLGSYGTGRELVTEFSTIGGGDDLEQWLFEDDDFSHRVVDILADDQSVHLTLEALGDEQFVGTKAKLDAEQARVIGDALYQAANTLEQQAADNGRDS